MRISDWSSDVCSSDLNVDKVPVPGSSFKTEVLTRCKVSLMREDQIDDQENGADQYVEAVKACRHVKGRAVGCAAKIERGMRIFIVLAHREHDATPNGTTQAGKSVVWGKRVSVRLDIGGRRITKK